MVTKALAKAMDFSDQRTMCRLPTPLGTYCPQTVDEVRAVWTAVAERKGLTLHDDGEAIAAYVNHARWVGDCPECGGGVPGWPEHDKGACLDCGGIYDMEYPDADAIAKAAVILGARPTEKGQPVHANWYPATETLADLQAESALMAPLPADFGGFVIDGRRLGANELTAQHAATLQSRHLAAAERTPRALDRGRL